MWPLHFQLGRTCMDLRIQSQSFFLWASQRSHLWSSCQGPQGCAVPLGPIPLPPSVTVPEEVNRKFKRDLSYAVLLLCLIKFRKGTLTFVFNDTERPYVDPDISGTHCRMAIGRLIKEHALSQGLSRPEYLPQHRPPWWPEELPFASASDGKGEGRKAFTAEKLSNLLRHHHHPHHQHQQQQRPPTHPHDARALGTSSSITTSSL
ncbi:uncharacterized protein LOC143104289 [Alosa pseudoharengus]|uniref:uncharacterized protein LOC143104289 n=1 Tax=Alosa pseudoharengus TaxID=34774 RepID=UPI003F8B5E1B